MLLEEFDTGRGTLNFAAAAQMAALCSMVYEDEVENARAFVGPESTVEQWVQHEGTWVPSFAVIKSGPNRWYVIIEGTISLLQALAQASPLNTLRRPDDADPDFEQFFGLFYYQVYLELLARIANVVPLNDPRTRLFLSGHSMGGAVAQVGAYQFAKFQDPTRVQLLTLGQPQCMGVNYLLPRPDIYWRVVSNRDIVPSYPYAPATWVVVKVLKVFNLLVDRIAWRHYGEEWILHTNGTLDGAGPYPNPLPEGLAVGVTSEHSLNNYLARILLAAEVQEPDS